MCKYAFLELFCVLCITTQHAHHESLKRDPISDLLTPSPATSSAVSPSGSCPPLSYHRGHHRETPGSWNGIPGVLGLALASCCPAPRAQREVRRGEGTSEGVVAVWLSSAHRSRFSQLPGAAPALHVAVFPAGHPQTRPPTTRKAQGGRDGFLPPNPHFPKNCPSSHSPY